MTNMTYPSGAALAYQYDAMSRLSGITQNGAAIATAGYTAASQLSTLLYGTNTVPFYESRNYNILMQLTNLTVTGTGAVNMQYNYTAGQNNGRVSSTTDGVLGETVNYGYDMWNRLASALATNGSWGEAYTFDGFGNLTGKTPTAGSAPAMSVPADPTTNRPMGGSYDANGNPSAGGVWDVENRLIGMGAEANYPATTDYAYDPWGRRIWKETPGGLDGNGNPFPPQGEFYFYGATGQKLETYTFSGPTPGPEFGTVLEGINIYFGRKLLQAKGVWVATDKLGSVRANSNGESFSYFPYGEERTSTADGREKFATYTRDGFGQDYAEQRYYNANLGAFWSPDPGGIATAKASNPLSWNRYVYVNGDPINHTDRHGRIVDASCVEQDGVWVDDGDGSGCDDEGQATGGDSGTTISATATGCATAGQQVVSNGTCDVPLDQFGQSVVNLVQQYDPAGFLNFSLTVMSAGPVAAGITALGGAAVGDVILLGSFADGYVNIGGVVGAAVFSVPSAVWNSMSAAAQWAANQAFLDTSIANNSTILFLSNPNLAAEGSGLYTEWQYLQSVGYSTLTAAGNGAFQATGGH